MVVKTAKAVAFYYLATTCRSRRSAAAFLTPSPVRSRSLSSATPISMSLDIASNLQEVRDKIQQACSGESSPSSVRLVAVSKTKPNALLMECYHADQRIFGENYVQELVDKASSMPADITWHFIGPLQSNKAKLLVSSVVPKAAGLVVETVASLKLAKKLQSAMEDHSGKVLGIFIQVNTSGEDSKSGVEPAQVAELCRGIIEECPSLVIRGLMTIGAPGDVGCFDTLRTCRDETVAALALEAPLELSMGMSDDFQQAIARGATNVRVGSTIFGARDYSNK
jgi:PLP dependent protein